jgi:MoxR-like ATPase
MGIALNESKGLGLVMPGLALAHQLYLAGQAEGYGRKGTQALMLASRAFAAIAGRDFATPDDVKSAAYPVLEHRIILRPEYEIEGLSVAEVVERILGEAAVPR